MKVHHCHPFKDEAYPHLAKLVALKELDLTVLDSTPKGLAPLKECKGLEHLELAHFQGKGEGLLEALAELSQVKHAVVVAGSAFRPVSESELDAIVRMTNLDHLKLYNTDFTADQLNKIKTALPSTEIEIRRRDKPHEPSSVILKITPEQPRM